MQTKVSQMNQSFPTHFYPATLEASSGVPTAALSTMAFPVASQRSTDQGLPFKKIRRGGFGVPQDDDHVMQDRSNQILDLGHPNVFSGCTP